jgi:ABC-type uncharacterized transport system permease subunit
MHPLWSKSRTLLQLGAAKLFYPCCALLFALACGLLLIIRAGKNPWHAYQALFTGACGNPINCAESLVYVTPLILTGLSIAVAYRCGLFNIGAEGQFIMGMIAAAWVGAFNLGLPAWIHLPLTMLAGSAAGFGWGSIPGYLKAKFGAHEVIMSIMTNYMALHLTGYLVNQILIAPPGNSPMTRAIQASARLARILPPSRLNTGIFVALAALPCVYLFLWKTKWGFEIRAVGYNPDAARYAGINVPDNIILAMGSSGALSGLAGALQIQGIQYCFNDLFGFPGYGFDGIAVALLGNNHPAGILLSACLFGALNNGALQMQSRAGITNNLIGVIQAIMIFFIATDSVVKWRRPWKKGPVAAETAVIKEDCSNGC